MTEARKEKASTMIAIGAVIIPISAPAVRGPTIPMNELLCCNLLFPSNSASGGTSEGRSGGNRDIKEDRQYPYQKPDDVEILDA